MGKLSWIIWVATKYSQKFLPVIGEDGRMKFKDATLLALKMDAWVTNLEPGKGKKTDSLLEPPNGT